MDEQEGTLASLSFAASNKGAAAVVIVQEGDKSHVAMSEDNLGSGDVLNIPVFVVNKEDG